MGDKQTIEFYNRIYNSVPTITIDMLSIVDALETVDEVEEFFNFLLGDRLVEIIEFPKSLRALLIDAADLEYNYILKMKNEEMYLGYFMSIDEAKSYCTLNGYALENK